MNKIKIIFNLVLLVLVVTYDNNLLLVAGFIYSIISIMLKLNLREKYQILPILIIGILSSLFLGIHYKLVFNLIIFSVIGFYFRKVFLNVLIIALIISPPIYLSNLNMIKDFSQGFNYHVANLKENRFFTVWNEINGDYKNELSNNISYYYNMCQLYAVYCEPIKNNSSETSSVTDMSVYFKETTYFDNYGNLYRIVKNKDIDSKRYIYSFNNLIANKNYRYKSIFVPLNSEEVVIYNYSLFRNIIWEKVLKSNNKCKLLFYGTQNGWKKYQKQLITELQNDSKNHCINNIEDYNFEINKDKLERDKIDLIKELKIYKSN